jgi:TolB protein
VLFIVTGKVGWRGTTTRCRNNLKVNRGLALEAARVPIATLFGVSVLLCAVTLKAAEADTDCLIPGGWLTYVSNGDVYTMRPDGWHKKRLTHHGTATWPAYSMNGCRIIFMSQHNAVDENPHQAFNRLYIMRTAGTHQTALTASLQSTSHPRLNRQGTKVVYSKQLLFGTSRTYHALFQSNANGSSAQEINNHDVRDPAWSWTGNGLVCTAGTTGNVEDPAFEQQPDIYVMAPVGAALTPLTNNPAYDGEPELSPDSSKIVFVSKRDGNAEIYMMNRDGSGQTRLTSHAGNDISPIFSPDGQTIAWVSNRDGDNEIYTMKIDGTGQKQITINTVDDKQPHWR